MVIRCSFLAVFLSLISSVIARGQTSELTRPVKAFLTISPSKGFTSGENYFYVHGNLEAFISPRISLAGDGFYSLGAMTPSEAGFDYVHSCFFGANLHWRKSAHDFYAGFQPGLDFSRIKGIDRQSGVNPVVSFPIGYNFFVSRVFHFFVQTRFVVGEHHQDVPKSLSELRLSAGLGFNYWKK